MHVLIVFQQNWYQTTPLYPFFCAAKFQGTWTMRMHFIAVNKEKTPNQFLGLYISLSMI